MKAKEFLRPDERKIVVLAIITVMAFILQDTSGLFGCYKYVPPSAQGVTNDCPPAPVFFFPAAAVMGAGTVTELFPHLLPPLVLVWYLISCLIVWYLTQKQS